ncbi:EAL domain-containing protein [Sulfurospirillum diekertiae]|uniref:EAL domain-containing protein n=1 Tax=Sulfurospirillum diekertiae TaxID=1854492 RepID=A0A6G9VSG7_9BACT|nr:EAL domain-containing protein [Sulfurospirillum diekertiae]QIR75910.1 EAL domain-containing protein [Sulfurospirillum diekertiae]QIR78552.1 EAL domain-containing protein [Sulfurospirillum diekertiae]
MKKEIKYELTYGRISPITELPDRQRFLNTLKHSNANKLALLNVNGFWNFNHVFGYAIGDEILKIISQRLQKRFPHSVVFHLGGDNFAVLAGKEVGKEAFIQAINACMWYFGYSPIEIEEEKIYVAIRMGVAIDYVDLFLNAEFAIKQAKRIGKDMVIYDSESVPLCRPNASNARADLEWQKAIRQALLKDRFEVYAQGIQGGKVKKFECLVRMKSTNGGVISPYHFLEQAKRANLYNSITKVVIEKSFAFFADKEAEFSVNLTLSDILDQETANFIIEKMYAYSVGSRLTIELVESEHIENHPEVVAFLTTLKQQGVKIAIDDFGTGYSNFEYVAKLQADYIKIDGSLIRNITKNATHRAVVEAIVTFAKKVGMETVAEFVSDFEIYEACQEQGIDYFQGYLWNEPQPLRKLKL